MEEAPSTNDPSAPMPTLITDSADGLPLGAIAARLAEVLPSFRWIIDDAPAHKEGAMLPPDRPLSVMGRLGERMVLVVMTPRAGAMPNAPGAPAHRRHYAISRPTTDDDGLARRVLLSLAEPVLAHHGPGALLSFEDEAGADWFDANGLAALIARRDEDPTLAERAAFAQGAGGTVAAGPATHVSRDRAALEPPPASAPRHDPPVPATGPLRPPAPSAVPSAARPVAPAPGMRRGGGFGRKGLSP